MSEDEAFLRVIVDSPGDDTPRLVYADWLDDRGDPRGPYLRAETEWAKRRRKANWKPPVTKSELRAVSALRQQAADLDPFWVARVSRPPLGVCCDNLVFTESGPQLTVADIHEFEERTGGDIPLPLQAFLLNHNGGRPKPAKEAPPSELKQREDRILTVDLLFPLRKRARRAGEKLTWGYPRDEFGGRGHGEHLLIGRLADADQDELWWWVDEVMRYFNSDDIYDSYGNLMTFLSRIGHPDR